jgi:hypothetical protein
MSSVKEKYLKDEDGNKISPITALKSVYTSAGTDLATFLPQVRPVQIGGPYGEYKTSYSIDSTLATLATHYIFDYRLYNSNYDITAKVGSQIVRADITTNNDNFAIFYVWNLDSSILTTATSFTVNKSEGTVDVKSTNTNYPIGLAKVWAILDVELMV